MDFCLWNYSMYFMKKARVQYEVLPIWSNWAEWMSTRLAPNSHHKWIATSDYPIQHVRSKSLQKTYPRDSRNHLLLFFRKVLDTYCNKTFLKKSITCNNKQNLQFLSYSYNLIDLGSCSLQTQLLNLWNLHSRKVLLFVKLHSGFYEG